MALIALLNYEEKIQVDDKTRLDASQSFASRGSSPITVLTIKPEASASAISVFNSTIQTQLLILMRLVIKFISPKVARIKSPQSPLRVIRARS
jgi:hypothetical protein